MYENHGKFESQQPYGGDVAVEKDGVQRNIYIDASIDEELTDETHLRKKQERAFNVSRLIVEAWTVYRLAKRYRDQSKSENSVFEFTRDAMELFMTRKPVK
jgi:hypothetical protein